MILALNPSPSKTGRSDAPLERRRYPLIGSMGVSSVSTFFSTCGRALSITSMSWSCTACKIAFSLMTRSSTQRWWPGRNLYAFVMQRCQIRTGATPAYAGQAHLAVATVSPLHDYFHSLRIRVVRAKDVIAYRVWRAFGNDRSTGCADPTRSEER